MGALEFGYTFFALTAIIAARYFLVAGLFHYALLSAEQPRIYAMKLSSRRPNIAAMKKEIYWSIISSFIYALPATAVLMLWQNGGTQLYTNVDEYGWVYIPFSIGLYLFLHDTYFYWTHRAMHLPHLFSFFHKVHHESRPTSPWAAFSFHPSESLVGAIFLPFLALFIPIHIGALLFILTLMTVCAVLNHSGYEVIRDSWIKKGFLGRHFITATHHNVHHENYHVNFGLYFRFWDKLMKTDLFDVNIDGQLDSIDAAK